MAKSGEGLIDSVKEKFPILHAGLITEENLAVLTKEQESLSV